jgi:hypothetical protein
VYELCALTYVLALAHFSSEVFVYKTASIRAPGVISPLIVACECTTRCARRPAAG